MNKKKKDKINIKLNKLWIFNDLILSYVDFLVYRIVGLVIVY